MLSEQDKKWLEELKQKHSDEAVCKILGYYNGFMQQTKKESFLDKIKKWINL